MSETLEVKVKREEGVIVAIFTNHASFDYLTRQERYDVLKQSLPPPQYRLSLYLSGD